MYITGSSSERYLPTKICLFTCLYLQTSVFTEDIYANRLLSYMAYMPNCCLHRRHICQNFVYIYDIYTKTLPYLSISMAHSQSTFLTILFQHIFKSNGLINFTPTTYSQPLYQFDKQINAKFTLCLPKKPTFGKNGGIIFHP